MDVKNALEEAGGDEEKAIEILRKRGQAQAVKKADREQSEGGIFISEGGGKASLVFLKSETDFVSRSEGFQALGRELSEKVLKDGKEAAEQFAAERIPKAVLEFGENISIGSMVLVEAPIIGTYVHSNQKIGVIIGLDKGDASAAKDAAMHAAAMNLQVVSPNDVPNDAVVKEREIWKEQLAKEGKPADIQEKIMAGKEKKFREENALLTQPFVKDPSKTVGATLGVGTVVSYQRVAFR
jgi:elongation factor Ts